MLLMPTPMQSTQGFVYVPSTPETPTPVRAYDLGGDVAVRSRGEIDRSKSWCFTVNNYAPADELELELLKGDNSVLYIVVGKEVGESGTPHLQGFVQFKNRRVFGVVKDLLPRGAHIERARGSVFQAAEYCKKEGDFWEFVNLC